jgi:predicted nucleic acid-binding protein
MRIVLDSNVAIKWRLPEADSDSAFVLKESYIQGLNELIAPYIFPVEVGHALSRAERKGILKPPEAAEALKDILLVCPKLYSYIPLLPRAMEISSETRTSVYDCLYISLAEREDCCLVTADAKLINSLGETYKTLVQLL